MKARNQKKLLILLSLTLGININAAERTVDPKTGFGLIVTK